MAKKKYIKELTPLEKYGITVGFLGLLGWVNLPFVLLFLYATYKNEFPADKELLGIVFLVGTIVSVVSLVLSYFKSIIKRFQFFVYILIAAESLVMLIWLDFLGLILFSMKDGRTSDNLMTENFWIFIFPLAVLFVLSLVFFYFYHKNESVYKLNNYFNNGKSSKGVASVPIIFSGVMASRMFFEGNATFLKITGIIVAVMLTAVIPVAIMGGLFSAAYIRKYPDRKEIQ